MSEVSPSWIVTIVKGLLRAIRVLTVTVLALGACGDSATVVGAPADVTPGTIVTVAGNGEPGFGTTGMGGPATEAPLRPPVDLAFDAAGNLYVAERLHHRILRIDPAGIVTLVAGRPQGQGMARGFSGDGGPATEAELRNAHAVAVGPDGNLYIADSGNHRIRKVDADGIITTVAGTGELGFSGDGGPATQAALATPLGLVLDGEGNLYFWDSANFRIRMVDRDGIVSTVAGTGKSGSSPDGTPATEANLGGPFGHQGMGLAFDPAGQLHITDLGNSRIWMIDAAGRLRAVAGNGESTYSGDGGPATEAGINQPLDIAIDRDGNLYIATHTHESEGHRVRKVDSEGIITTIAGTSTSGYSGDGGPATEAELNIPVGVVVGPDGNLYIADGANNVIRMVALPDTG